MATRRTPEHKAVHRVDTKISEVFDSLEKLPFLREDDRREFLYFRRLFHQACLAIDQRAQMGQIQPWPRTILRSVHELVENGCYAKDDRCCLLRCPDPVRVGVFIGSFDPFQMTHLETALRFLSKSRRGADIVFVVPEGAYTHLKPGRSDYQYRFDILSRQCAYEFRPLIVPLDIGDGEGTIGIVNRLIRVFAGRRLELTHVLGSDVLPYAYSWLDKDLATWYPQAEQYGVDLDFGMFVVRRSKYDDVDGIIRSVRHRNIPIQLDGKPIGTPSSTALRERGIFTVVFPTAAVLEKLEVVFRYGMHRNWMHEAPAPEWEI